MDFYTKSEVNEKFGTETTEDTGRDFYTKVEIIEKVGTPETLVLPTDMLDFYTKTEIDSIPTAPTYDETKIAVIWLENDEPAETIEYFDTLSDARSYMYNQYAADRRFWVRLGKQLPTTQEFTPRYFSTFPCIRKFTAYSGIDGLPSYAFADSPNLKEVYTKDAGFIFEDAKDASEYPVYSRYVFDNCQSLEKIEIVGTSRYQNKVVALTGDQIGRTPNLKYIDLSFMTYGINYGFEYAPLLETFIMRKLCSEDADLHVGYGGKIGNESFKDFTLLRAVDITVTDALYVMKEAFAGCTSLENVSISYDVSQGGEIASDAFTGCDGVTITINAPENSISGAPWGATNVTVIWTG